MPKFDSSLVERTNLCVTDTMIRYTIEYPDDFLISTGWGCGYVGVDSSHPAFEEDDEISGIDVHGGVTFARFREIEGKTYKVFGFDTGHCGDNGYDQDEDFVVRETLSLFAQLEAML